MTLDSDVTTLKRQVDQIFKRFGKNLPFQAANQLTGVPGQLIGAGALQQIGTTVQPAGPLAGVAGPPIGLSGFGGEVALATMTLTLPIGRKVFLLALASDQVVAVGPAQTQHPVYFQIDGVDVPATEFAFGEIPVYNALTRTSTTTLGYLAQMTVGPHTVNLIWNSAEGANDTCYNTNNQMFAFLAGA